MPEVMFQVVAFGLENVERLVLDLPACPATGGEFGDVVLADRSISDEAVAVINFAGGIDGLDPQPVDHQCVFAVA